MTVDVEDYFQVQAFAGVIERGTWDSIPRRVEANTERVLAQFARAGVRGTFFTLGWIAERHPELVRQIVAAGHELASHGYGHALVDRQGAVAFAEDIRRAKSILEDLGGVPVRGYRAPTFSMGPHTPWAFEALEAAGYTYSSSVYPVRHDLYGAPDSPRFPYRPGPGALLELPLTTLRLATPGLGARNVPIAGGGYFRLAPYALFRTALRRFHKVERAPAVFYFHPWEVDPDQPRIRAAARLSRFRHSVNLRAMAGRLEHLLRDFRWGRMDEVYASALAAPRLLAGV